MGVDVTTLSMSSCACGVSCVGGIVGSLCVTVLGVGAIIMVVVVLFRRYSQKNSIYEAHYDNDDDVVPETLVSKNVAHVQSSQVRSIPLSVTTNSEAM